MGGDIDGEAGDDRSGNAVSLSSSGKIVAIGALFNGGNGDNSGHVRIYMYDDNRNDWIQMGGDIDGEAAGDWSGSAVSLSSNGKIVAIGAYGNDENGYYSGHVRIYMNIEKSQYPTLQPSYSPSYNPSTNPASDDTKQPSYSPTPSGTYDPSTTPMIYFLRLFSTVTLS